MVCVLCASVCPGHKELLLSGECHKAVAAETHNNIQHEIVFMLQIYLLWCVCVCVVQDEKVKLTCTDRMPAYLTTVMMMCFLVSLQSPELQ